MRLVILILLMLTITSSVWAKKTKELDYASLEKDYNNLVHNENYKDYAKNEKQIAKKSVEALINGQVRRKDRKLALYLARHNIAYARLTAEEEWIKQEIEKQKDIAHSYEVAISKTESQIARHDAEMARMMLIAQQEEAQRSNARADQAEREAQNSRDQAQEANLAKQEAELAMEEADSLRKKLNSIATEQTDKGLMMTLGDFVFDSGRSTIKQEAVDNFSKVVDFINTYPNKKVRIEGHTDSSGSNKLNLKLSQKRADAVKNLLIKNGISASQIQAVSMGEDFPIAENSTNAGKAKNRRVEIIILK